METSKSVMKKTTLVLLLLLLLSCKNKNVDFNDFDKKIFPTLKEFQRECQRHKDRIHKQAKNTTYVYSFITNSTFEKHFSFLDTTIKKDIILLLKNQKILWIDCYDVRNIHFCLCSKANIWDTEWKELHLFYSEYPYPSYWEVKQVDSCWFLLLKQESSAIKG